MAHRDDAPQVDHGDASRRRDRFHDEFGDAGIVEADVLRDCLIASHGFIAEIIGRNAADAGFDVMMGRVFGKAAHDQGWEGSLYENDGLLYSELAMGRLFHDLNAYAYEGIALNGASTEEERRALLCQLIERSEHFFARIPFDLWEIDGAELERTMLLARGRWALDNGLPIEARALAIFGDVSLQRIRNMMSKTEGTLSKVNGRIAAKDALDWLRNRPKSFRPSIWQQQETFDDLPGVESGRLQSVMFVPVGSDGTVFHPGLRRDGVYRIGNETKDVTCDDFSQALVELQSMATPVWRRPTPQGLWTRVQGVRWERMTMADLEQIDEGPMSD